VHELVANGRTIEEIQKVIGADWLIYQDLDALVRAVHHENAEIEVFDTSCFSGDYVTGDVSQAYLDQLGLERSDSAKVKRNARVVREEESDDEGDEGSMQVATGL
jgi:amidophosphoribosyltransferase